ncbi:hypothetical protein [Zobellella sp. DQSA1]|uniref:hypothetical protein n=1 Tax=Zobellella sp. DQSA1 TaxID=3342386 RepID=UPI0035C0555E
MSKVLFPLGMVCGAVIGAVAYPFIAPDTEGANTKAVVSAPSLQNTSFPINGEITLSAPLNFKDGSRYRVYTVEADRQGLLKIEQKGSLNGALSLYRGRMDSAAGLSSKEASEGKQAYVWLSEAEQTPLTLVVSGLDADAYGPFNLEAEWLEVRNGGELRPGEEVQGFINKKHNNYTITIAEEGFYSLDMRSDDIDSYLRLKGNGINLSNDDGGDGHNAKISTFLSPGSYRVAADTAGSEGIGLYDIELTSVHIDDDYVMGGEIEIGQNVRGMLIGKEALYYTLTLSEPRILDIDLRSSEFDTAVDIEGNGVSLSDDDGGQGTNSRLVTEELEAGTYRLRIYGITSSGGLDEFQLFVN